MDANREWNFKDQSRLETFRYMRENKDIKWDGERELYILNIRYFLIIYWFSVITIMSPDVK